MKLAKLFKHHLDLRYILTPLCTVNWELSNKNVRMVYIFGIRVARIHLDG